MTSSQESIFRSIFRAFFSSFASLMGLAAALLVLVMLFGYFYKNTAEEESFSSKITILPDAEGRAKKLGGHAPIVIQITLDGQIGQEGLTGKKIEEILLESRSEDFDQKRIKGILLVINSPGGDANESDIIYRHLMEYKKRYMVPIYAYIDGLGASGGYYIACAADKIYASPVSLVGSIGVLSWPPYMNVTHAMEKLGVEATTLSAGKGKDSLNPFRPWKPDEDKQAQEILNFLYSRFVTLVSDSRPNLDKEALVQEWGARVFPAPQAHAIGLIDGSGFGRSEALHALAASAGIVEKYQVIGFETSSWWRRFLKEESRSPWVTGKMSHEVSLPTGKIPSFHYLYAP